MTRSHRIQCGQSAPQQARDWAYRQLASAADAGISGDLIADVLLCISELVTNAVRAPCDQAMVELALSPGRVRVLVTDDGPGWPTTRRPGPKESHGRGLMIVSTLAESWGIEPRAASKIVWAEFAESD